MNKNLKAQLQEAEEQKEARTEKGLRKALGRMTPAQKTRLLKLDDKNIEEKTKLTNEEIFEVLTTRNPFGK